VNSLAANLPKIHAVNRKTTSLKKHRL
jgi:hypothetical protein